MARLLEQYPEVLAALCVWREARGEPYAAKLAVAKVLYNRAASGRWPTDLDAVVLQPLQFSSFNKTDANAVKFPNRKVFADWRSFEESCQAVEEARNLASDEPLHTANHYFDSSISPPSWVEKMEFVGRVGKLIFYRA